MPMPVVNRKTGAQAAQASAAGHDGQASRPTSLPSSPSVMARVAGLPYDLLFNPTHYWALAGLLLVFESLLNVAIIHKVSYTNIDWVAYMQEVEGFLAGERDYVNLKGETGPLVYPAGFVYVYSALWHVTSQGTNVRLAQYIFAGLYLVTMGVVMVVYRRALPNQGAYSLIPLVLSKRLHSIYTLRLFNDTVAMLPLYICILAMSRRRWTLATVFYSLALSIKMNILLFAPGMALLTYQALGLRKSIRNAGIVIAIQVVLALPFLTTHATSYLCRAFDFGRAFFYKWTVNWRFVDEGTFLSRRFSRTLLVAHVFLLLVFLVKWCAPFGGVRNVVAQGLARTSKTGRKPLPAEHIVLVMFICNLIGITCARSLHYQFWSWYAHTVPYLVWLPVRRTTTPVGAGVGVIVRIIACVALEYAWNVYPSTNISSGIMLAVHAGMLLKLLLAPPVVVAPTPSRKSEAPKLS
ncbi:asparagine-linked glycosylation 3 [Fimicolochytrium jonesii]|uniref:asparagine-linked glycosylation 3 n=1 Tax=Fimicolochytrium jonesii TaxID=1396493 RepID=UPI0022FE9D0E|nr:asparagine-linked glycosylation 3 [Fimicolochytrium jonesii]KAI8818937.1 asparagine-linked glycosylation 3 [Fimicolochytrium jonesii]